MSVSDLKNSSETNWERIDRMSDDEIDTSDIPPLADTFFQLQNYVFQTVRSLLC